MRRIGFIGLGVMGFNIANHLLNNFDCINVVSRNSYRTKKFIKANKNNKKLNVFNSISEIVNESNVIISCVGNDNDLRKVYVKWNNERYDPFYNINNLNDLKTAENMIKNIIS